MIEGNISKAILALAVTLACACVTPEPLPTRTGKPEVTIAGKDVTKKKIVDRAAYYMISDGYKIEKVDDYSAVFIKHGSTWRSVGDRMTEVAMDERITLNLLDAEGGINVIGTVESLTYPAGRGTLVEDYSTYGERAQWLFDVLYRVNLDLTSGQKGLAGKQGAAGR